MSDKLDWMNKHLVLLKHLTVQDAISKEAYKLRPDLEQFVTSNPMPSQEFLYRLVDAGKDKEACDFLAYAMHRRAAVWWGYRCMLSLNEELLANPVVERDIADIGAPKEMPIPDWAKDPDKEARDAKEAKDVAELLEKNQKQLDELKATYDEAMKYVPKNIKDMWNQAWGIANAEFKRVHGITVDELVQKAAKRLEEPEYIIDPNSPIFEAARKLKEEIEKHRKETIDLIKSVIPPKNAAHEKKLNDNAMQAVYRWVVAPDEVNAQAAYTVGNECPDKPAGLLALAAFWSYGDMMPMGKQVVPTPPGLAANGLCSVLLQAGLHKGGTRKYKERIKLYLDLGLDVVLGKDTWSESLEEKEPPHEKLQSQPTQPEGRPGTDYQKWNPWTKR